MLGREIGKESEEEFVIVDEQQLLPLDCHAVRIDGSPLDGIPADLAVGKEMRVIDEVKGLLVGIAVRAKLAGACHGTPRPAFAWARLWKSIACDQRIGGQFEAPPMTDPPLGLTLRLRKNALLLLVERELPAGFMGVKR